MGNMRCIFCKQSSDKSKGIEHIIPESLGNKEHVLPLGVVCDSCNWYFGTKVEKKLLEQPFFRHVRHRQYISTKRGKYVPWTAYSLFPIKNPENYDISAMTKDELLREIFANGNLFYPPFIANPQNPIMSRFLAKIAIEAMANVCVKNFLSLDEVIDNEGLNPLREYARYGQGQFWPYNQRKIYDENKMWEDTHAKKFQLLHEYNVISFEPNEYYLVLAIFGIEFAINFSNRNVNSFQEWLKGNQDILPLSYENFPTPYLE